MKNQKEFTGTSENKVCCIFGAGEYYSGIRYNNTEIIPRESFIIAADGGLDHLVDMGIIPNLVVGDFDSLCRSANGDEISDIASEEENNVLDILRNTGVEYVRLNPVKDETDTLWAVKYAIEHGYNQIRLFGCTGGRTDHTIANIQILHMLAERNISGFLFGNSEVMTAFENSALKFSPTSHGYISIFSLSDISLGVTEIGLKYSLDRYDLKNTDTVGVSNEFTGKASEISVENGTLLAVFEDITFISNL